MVTDITPIGKRVFLTPINAVTWLAEAADLLVTEDLQKKKKLLYIFAWLVQSEVEDISILLRFRYGRLVSITRVSLSREMTCENLNGNAYIRTYKRPE